MRFREPTRGAVVFTQPPATVSPSIAATRNAPRGGTRSRSSAGRLAAGPQPDQPFLNKSLDKTADISGVEPKPAAQLAQIRAALPDLEQEPRATKGAAAAQEMIVERADPLGDEAVELPDLGDLVGAHCLPLVK